MIGLAKYARIKNHYCLAYFGPCEEYLFQLHLLKPIIENHFPGLKITFACRDEFVGIFSAEDIAIKVTEIKSKREDFAHVRELSFNGRTHPVEDLMQECEIKNYAINKMIPEHHTVKAVIITKTQYPAKNLTDQQAEKLEKIAKQMGYEVERDSDIKNASLVMGVESLKLFKAAQLGSKVILVPTGIGTRLYKTAFPELEVMSTY
jgi:hypothetical protein